MPHETKRHGAWRRAIIFDLQSLALLMAEIMRGSLSLVLSLAVMMIFVTQTPIWKRWHPLRAGSSNPSRRTLIP
ncbi:MAG: hypothetical protein U1D35_07120 [Paracoccaceae bacterium]|nr:hypothetical protein [Paracoccaceae bacterium]